ncbi:MULTISPECIES: hypothetical protein [unclassified Rathayibacter]|uniref:hypothetical protein n=1 Tax=unclassified Rathayibacter TaxID=2609250 RepID=UPI000FA22E0C|nr:MULTISPECIES: hypothetical protein [unclassified Rathayibacter]ROP50173.1 hypothetical protein EDF45_1582 [Rathayibacter sp. PhB186]ROS53131.1 hypothetical protein EDF44_1582 [Rathayibacter sp. PhB185]
MTSRTRLDRHLLAVASGAVGVVAALSLTSCGYGCHEIGYTNELRVTAAGARSVDVADIRLCADEICAYPSVDAAPATGRSYWVVHNTSGLWIYVFGDHHPDTVHLTLLDNAGRALDEQDHDIDWNLVDEPNGPGCGWRADPYDLTVSL